MSRAVISDFGGVLTSPLIEGFLAYQEESGVTVEELGRAMAAAAERDGEHPLFALEKGRISEAEFRRRLEAELPDGIRLERLRALYFERLQPNRTMIDFMPRADVRTVNVKPKPKRRGLLDAGRACSRAGLTRRRRRRWAR